MGNSLALIKSAAPNQNRNATKGHNATLRLIDGPLSVTA
jgi:hypothetical protein